MVPAPASRRPATLLILVLATAVLPALAMLQAVAGGAPAAGVATLRSGRGGTRITKDARTDTWTIGSGDTPLAVGFNGEGSLVLRGIGDGSSSALSSDVEDATIVLNGHEIVLGDREDEGVHFAGDRAEDYRNGLRLTLSFNVPDDGARVDRHFVTYPGSSVIETWFEVARLEDDVPVLVEGLSAWRVGVAGRTVHWLRGLDLQERRDLAFEDGRQALSEGESVTIGAAGRSTEANVPWVTVPTPQGTFFGGLLWSGAWRIVAVGGVAGTAVAARLDDTQTTVPAGRTLEGVHGFFGVASIEPGAVAAAMRTFLIDGLRGGREFPALVTYNTWFVHGARINEHDARTEIAHSAQVGAELFQLDAGWHQGAGTRDHYDYTSGLGSWAVDDDRFPHGLRVLGEDARNRGMKFALWVEPERADLATVDTGQGPREAWLATTDGLYRPGHANGEAGYAQVCLAHPDAWQWVFEHLARLVEEQGVDYVKIDNNDWINCTREGHDHGPRDGNFAHVQALYRLLAALRERFPRLLIENCAGGGNRIDLGLARYTDAGWMDDRTVPSVHVRHNLEGLSQLLPPSYLLSYAMPSPDEPMSAEADFALLARSRMPGVLGISYRSDEIGEAEYVLLGHEVDVYKRARAISARAHAVHLSARTSEASRPAWELTEHVVPDGSSSVVYAFQNDSGAHSVRVVLTGLDPNRSFALHSADEGLLGVFSGQQLMTSGYELFGTPNTAAQVILVEPSVASAAAGKTAKRP